MSKKKKKIEETINKYTTDEFSVVEYLKSIEADQFAEEEEHYKFISIFELLDAPRILPDPVELTFEHLKQIEDELGLIKLCWPVIEEAEFEGRTQFPPSYLGNNEKEKLLLFTTENFRQEFRFRYPERKQLFLACDNECGIQKMVCTTIRATTLPYPETETWQLCSTFFGDYLKFEPLEIPTLFPNRLCSPHTVILKQSGNCFEAATALCSLLLGIGYDAYVVSGYAIQDVTLNIMVRVDSPYPPKQEKVEEAQESQPTGKYDLKPPRDLRSKFLMMMEQRVIDKQLEEKRREEELEQERLKAEEALPEDDLSGLRIHAWILMLTKGRKIDEPFFIEPSTGAIHELNTFVYSGIESVWNNENYWVNMQECTNDLSTLDYDLSNIENWEHLLMAEPINLRKDDIQPDVEEEEAERIKIYEEKHLDMPDPWSTEISLPHSLLANKYPGGVKKTWYKRTLVQEFAPYVQEDGLVVKVTRFDDFECTRARCIEDTYANRQDKMYRVVADLNTGLITEYFTEGREDCAIKHSYYETDVDGVERIIEFSHRARHDALASLSIKPNEITEKYVKRENLMYYRNVKYAAVGHPPPGMVEGHKRIIMNVIEKFERDESVPASKDIAQREFAVYEREVHLRFHYGTGKVTSSTRNFIKPPISEMGGDMKFNPDLTSGYHADLKLKPPRDLELFLLLKKQIEAEEKTTYQIRDLEDQIADFLRLRCLEVAVVVLIVDLFNREHNEEYRLGMLEREQHERDHKAKEIEANADYLQPYLERLEDKTKIRSSQAAKLREMCLTDFKQMLLQRANVIQQQFEQATASLMDKKQWYIVNQDNLTPDEEIAYFEEVNTNNFLLQALEERLGRHRSLSFIRYKAMVQYLDSHPLLAILRRK